MQEPLISLDVEKNDKLISITRKYNKSQAFLKLTKFINWDWQKMFLAETDSEYSKEAHLLWEIVWLNDISAKELWTNYEEISV